MGKWETYKLKSWKQIRNAGSNQQQFKIFLGEIGYKRNLKPNFFF